MSTITIIEIIIFIVYMITLIIQARIINNKKKEYNEKIKEANQLKSELQMQILQTNPYKWELEKAMRIQEDIIELQKKQIKEQEFSKIQVVALFARLVGCGCFRTDRDYTLAKELLKSHLGINYDNCHYYEFEEETNRVVYNETNKTKK